MQRDQLQTPTREARIALREARESRGLLLYTSSELLLSLPHTEVRAQIIKLQPSNFYIFLQDVSDPSLDRPHLLAKCLSTVLMSACQDVGCFGFDLRAYQRKLITVFQKSALSNSESFFSRFFFPQELCSHDHHDRVTLHTELTWLWLPHLWNYPRPGWTGLESTLSKGRCLCPWQGCWKERALPVQTILWFCAYW